MWLALGVLLAIVLLFVFILLLPIHILIENDDDKKMSLFIRVLFIKIDPAKIASEKSKKPKKKKTKESAVTRAAKEAFGLKHFAGGREFKKAVRQKGIAAVLGEALEFVRSVITALAFLVQKLTVKKLHIYSVSADTDCADAAMDYGLACATVYPIVGFVQSAVNVKEKGLKIDLRCDFEAVESQFSVEADIKLYVVHLLRAVLQVVKDNLKKGETK